MSCSCSKSFSGPNVIDDDYYGDYENWSIQFFIRSQ